MRGRRLHVKPGLAEAGSARRARSCQRFGRPRPSGEKGTSEAPGQGSSTRYWANTSPCRFRIGIEGDESARGSMRRANRRTQAMAWARTTSGRRGRRGLRTDERALREGGSHCVATRVHIPLLGFCRQTNDAGDTKGLAMSQAGDSRAERRARKAASPQPLRPSESGDCPIRHLQAKQSRPAVANRTFPHRDPKRSCFGNESAEIFRYCTASRAKTTQSAWESLFPLRFGTLFRKNPHLFTATRARTPRS